MVGLEITGIVFSSLNTIDQCRRIVLWLIDQVRQLKRNETILDNLKALFDQNHNQLDYLKSHMPEVLSHNHMGLGFFQISLSQVQENLNTAFDLLKEIEKTVLKTVHYFFRRAKITDSCDKVQESLINAKTTLERCKYVIEVGPINSVSSHQKTNQHNGTIYTSSTNEVSKPQPHCQNCTQLAAPNFEHAPWSTIGLRENENWAVALSRNWNVSIWNVTSGRLRREFQIQPLNDMHIAGLDVNHKGTRFVLQERCGTIHICRLSKEDVIIYTVSPNWRKFNASWDDIFFRPESNHFVAISHKWFEEWDASSKTCVNYGSRQTCHSSMSQEEVFNRLRTPKR